MCTSCPIFITVSQKTVFVRLRVALGPSDEPIK